MTGTDTMTLAQSPTDAVPIAGVGILPVAPVGSAAPQITLDGRILLAEDGVDNQQIISLYLRKAGADVVLAANGRIAVERAMAEQLDLILMDIEMPELDGYAATRELRDGGCTLPIIALTAHTSAASLEKCRIAFTGYIAKPVDRQTLLGSIAPHLSGQRPVKAAAAAPVAHEPIAPTRTLRSAFADDPAMQAAIAQFIAMLPRRVAHMKTLLASGNLAELRRAVHQIKGAGGGYGFDDITRVAAQLCTTLKQETPPETIAHELDLLLALIRSVEGYQLSQEFSHA
jgi:CheY-like chemotaxis protein